MNALDWKRMIFGLEVTLTCPNCGTVCPMENPFYVAEEDKPSIANGFRMTDFPAKISEKLLEASKNHRIAGCGPLLTLLEKEAKP